MSVFFTQKFEPKILSEKSFIGTKLILQQQKIWHFAHFQNRKRKTAFSQPDLLFNEILHLRKPLIGSLAYFRYWTGGWLKKHPVCMMHICMIDISMILVPHPDACMYLCIAGNKWEPRNQGKYLPKKNFFIILPSILHGYIRHILDISQLCGVCRWQCQSLSIT